MNNNLINIRFLTKQVIIFFAYYITALIGLNFDAVAGYATLIWPPAGIAIVALYLWGYQYASAILLASVLVNFSIGASFLTALVIGVGNTLSGIIGTHLLKNILNFNPSFERLKDSLSLIITSLLTPLISSVVGAVSLVVSRTNTLASFEQIFLIWWVGDSLGILIVGSLLFVWLNHLKVNLNNIKIGKTIEIVLLFAILLLLCAISFRGLFGIDSRRVPITQLLYPLLILFSVRLDPRLTISGVFFVACISVWGTYSRLGPFVRGSLEESLLYLVVFIATIGVTFIILSAVVAEKKRLQLLKDEFISAASHELKTPVTTIKAYIQLIGKHLKAKSTLNKNGNKDSSIDIYIARMDGQIDRLIKLIYELLDVSRIESGKINLETSRFKVGDLVSEIIKDFKRTESSYVITYHSKGNFYITADQFRIAQVLVNLISNAVKFSLKKKKIIITTTKKQGFVTFSVRDFGIGIESKYQREIFKRFFQTEQNQLKNSAGLGLGLYLSTEIVKKHGGKMWVESEMNKGSTFYFTLPIS